MRPSSPVCGVTSFMPENLSGVSRGFVRRFGELYAAGFAAAAGVNLRFHDDNGSAQALGDGARFVFLEDDFAARDGHAEFGEDRFGLIFVDLHACSIGFLRVALNSAKISGNEATSLLEAERRARSGVALRK